MKKEFLWGIFLFLAIPVFLFHESLFTERVLSQADVLFVLKPWRALVPPDFLPSNWLLMDQTFQFFPWLSFAREQFQKGAVPLWNPYSYSGSPLLANGQSAVFSPFHLLFYIFPFLKMFSISACLRLFCAALFMYFFMRSLGIGARGSTLSALSYQTCGFLIVLLNHPHSNPAIFLPLLFWMTERVCQKASLRRTALLSGVLFLQNISGHVATALIQTLAVFCYGVYRAKGSFRVGRLLVLAIVLGVFASAFVLVPTLEYALVSHAPFYRFEDKVPFFPTRSDFTAMLALFFPTLYGTPIRLDDAQFRNFNMLNQGFVGMTILVLAVGAFVGRKKERTIGFFAMLTLVAWGAAYHLPVLVTLLDQTGLLGFFQPSSWLLFSSFSLSALAGIGFDRIISSERKKASFFLRSLSALLLLVGLCAVGILLVSQESFPELSPLFFKTSLYFPIGLLVALLILSLGYFQGSLRSVFWRGGIFFLVILEHFLFAFRYNPTISPKNLFPPTPGIQFLLSDPDPDPFRILSLKGMLSPNTGMRYHLQEVRGYDALEYDPYMRYLEKIGPIPFRKSFFKLDVFHYYDSPLIDLLNAKYIISSKSLSGDSFRLVYDGEMKIYQNPKGFPRAWVFTEYEVLPEEERHRDRLVEKGFDVRKTVLLKEVPSLAGKRAKTWQTEWLSYEPNRLALRVALDGLGILFLSEVDYPGWKASLNGKRVPILRANAIFRSVILPPGTHRVEMVYDPTSFRVGLLLSGATFLFLLLLIFFP